jgi:hypothetical protein
MATLERIKEVFKSYQTVYQVIDKAKRVKTEEAIEKMRQLEKTKDPKEHKALKDEILKLLDTVLTLKPELQTSLKRWHEAGKILEKELNDEIAKREKVYKELWDKNEALKEINRIIKERNATRPREQQIQEVKVEEVPTDAVAEVKSYAVEVMLWLKYIEEKQSNMDGVFKTLEKVRKTISNLKPPKK